jgi:hypothetical protein
MLQRRGGAVGTAVPVEVPLPRRRLIAMILIALGVSVVAGLLGYALIVGPAFLD